MDLKGNISREAYHLERCEVCGRLGVYGTEVVEVEYRTYTGREDMMVACKDWSACWDRCGGWTSVGPKC